MKLPDGSRVRIFIDFLHCLRPFKWSENGSFSFVRFRHELKMYEGDFFILNGIMGYVDKVGERLEEYGPWNARLHLVFENGTEMNMLFLSLTHGLVRDTEGRKIILNGQNVRPDDTPVPTGYVYVLATNSTQPALQRFKPDLYKIGFTEGTVEERIKHAEKDKTFLEASVRIVMITQCFNINTHKLEALIHGFLGMQRLNISLRGLMDKLTIPVNGSMHLYRRCCRLSSTFLTVQFHNTGWTTRQERLSLRVSRHV
jgi:hypothetical protein